MESKNAESIDKSDQDDAFVENGTPKKVDENNVKCKKHRKCLRDKTTPRPPDSGYIQFLNERRKRFRLENKNLSFAEITKFNTKWNRLSDDKKKLYQSKAEYSKNIEKIVAAYKDKCI